MASDAELIGRSLSGDAEAFMEVIGRHEVAIGAYLERRAGREAAEDLLGDVWAAAFKYRGTYDQSFPEARPWLYTMALNRLRHYWRARSSEDLTVADAARVLGLPAGTARRLLHQARAALRSSPEVAALLTELNSVKGSK